MSFVTEPNETNWEREDEKKKQSQDEQKIIPLSATCLNWNDYTLARLLTVHWW